MVAPECDVSTLAGKRILLVEDDYLVAMGMVQMLESLGCEVVGPFPSVQEASERAEKNHYEGAVLDVNIRGGHSGSVAEIVRSRSRALIFITGYGSPSVLPPDLRRLPRLDKPVSRDRLLAALEREFRGMDKE